MTRFNSFAIALLAATALAACSVSEAGNIPCGDTTNCPAAYPTCSSKGFCVASAPAATLESVDGDAQTAISGSALTKSLTVRVLDSNGNAVAGAAIAWSATGTGSVSAASTTTGPDGKTSVVATLGKKNGSYSFIATAGALTGSPAKFTASGVSGPAAKLVAAAGANQTAIAGTVLGTPLAVMVTDINDNPVVGTTVSWAATSGGGSVALGSTTTVSDGTTSTVAVLGTVAGPNVYSASASFGGASLAGSPVVFKATGAAGAASRFVLTGPTATVAGVAQSYTLTVQDSNSNTAVGYTGTATLGSNDGLASLPASHVFTAADAGVLQFSATLKTAGTSTLTAVDGLLSASIPSIAVTPAAASSFVVAGFTTPTAADATHSFTVTAKDPFGNTATGYRGTVGFSSLNTLATLPTPYTFSATDAGVHGGFLAQLSFASSINTYDITATDTGNSAVAGAQTGITVNPGAANNIIVAGFPNPVDAGVPSFFTVTIHDAFANKVPGYLGTVHFATTDPGGTVPGNYQFVVGDSGSHTFQATLITASTTATYSISVNDTVNTSITGSQSGLVVHPAPATHFTVTGFPSSTVSAVTHSVTVTARDSSGNVATGFLDTVHFTSNNANANTVLPPDYTFTAGDAGIHTFTGVALATAGTGFSITATDAAAATITGSQTGITVTAAAASKLLVSAVATTIAGVAHSFTVTAQDASNNTAPSYRGNVAFTSSDSQATVGSGALPAAYTFTSGDAGVHTFSATLKTVGNQTITATDTGTSSITGTSAPVVVTPADAASFTVVPSVTTTVAGVPFGFTVTAKDAFGNVATGYPGTVHFSSNDAQAVVPVNTTLSAGVATLSATLKTVGASQTLTAADAVTASITGTSGPIAVTPSTMTQFLVTSVSSSQTAGTPFTVTVTAKDAFGNTTPSYTGTIAITSSDTAAVLPPNAAAVAGVQSFSVTLKTATTSSVTATDVSNGTLHGTLSGISVSPANASQFVVTTTASSPQTAGATFSVTATAKDQFGNIATGYLGTAVFSSTDTTAMPGSGLPGNYGFLASDNGVHTFGSVFLKKAPGTWTITVKDLTTATITGTSAGITMQPSTINNFLVSATTPQVAGTAFDVTVTARDQFNNTASGYTGTVVFSSNDTKAALPLNYTFTVGDAGVHLFTGGVTLKTATASATATITVKDSVTNTFTGTSAGIQVNPGAATTLIVAANSPQTAGVSFSMNVTAKDGSGNVATGYRGTVTFSSSDSRVSSGSGLPSNYTFVAGDNGTHGFTATLKTQGSQTLVATDAGNSITGQTSVTVNVGPTAGFLVTAATPQVSGTSFTLTVTAQDLGGNTTTGYTGTVGFASSDTTGATLPPNYTFLSSDNGTHPFTVTLRTAGAQTVTATDSVASISGVANITVNPGATTKLLLSGYPATAVQGFANSATVTAQDANGNTTPAYAGTVHLAVTGVTATVPTNYVFVPATDSGVHVFSITMTGTGTATITASDTGGVVTQSSQTGITVVSPPNLFGSTATTIVGGSRAGQVFIAGGCTTESVVGCATGNISSSTWFYNPSTGAMSAGPNLVTPRYAHTATATTGGQIVVAGGPFPALNGGTTNQFEFELCTTDTTPGCTNTGNLGNGNRCNAAAVLINTGQVMIAGGDDCATTTALTSWDILTSSTTSVSNGGSRPALHTGRRIFTGTMVGANTALFAGGASTGTADVFVFVPATPNNSTVTQVTMNAVRSGHSATILRASATATTACPSGTCVLIAGGNANTGKTWEIYDGPSTTFPSARAATSGHDLVVPGRNRHVAAAFSGSNPVGKVLIAGGNDGSTDVNSAESFDPTAPTLGWTTAAALGTARNLAAGAYASGQDLLIVVGGSTTAIPSVEQAATP